MEQYIISLFEGMSWLTIALLSAGVLLCIVEMFVPKLNLTGVLGISLLVAGISSYSIDGFSIKQIVSVLAIITLVLAVFIFIELILEAKGVIHNADRHKCRTYTSPSAKLNSLVGHFGKAVTDIALGGTIEINGNLCYAVSDIKIMAGSAIQVIGVQNNALVVKAC